MVPSASSDPLYLGQAQLVSGLGSTVNWMVCPVVVHQAHQEEDPPQDDHSMSVCKDDEEGQCNSSDHDPFAYFQAKLEILHIVKDYVRERRNLRHPLVGDDQGDGGCDHAGCQEQGGK